MKFNIFISLFLACSIAIFITGCGTGDGSTTTNFLNGIGYNLQLTVPETVNPGGSAIIRVVVKDPAGLPVPNGTKVTFTSTIGELEPKEAKTVNGIAACTYKAPKDTNTENPSGPVLDKVSAYSMGALAWSSNITIPYGFQN